MQVGTNTQLDIKTPGSTNKHFITNEALYPGF